MRIVTFTRPMRPWGRGDDGVVSDELAEKLVADGDATNSRPYPPESFDPPGRTELPEQKRPILHTKRYATRKRV